MIHNLFTHLGKQLQLKESWIIFFILGIIMMNFPFLHIFNKSIMLLGFPLLFLYFFIGWGVSIGVIYLFTIATKRHTPTDDEKKTA